jgi:hypothetical protein
MVCRRRGRFHSLFFLGSFLVSGFRGIGEGPHCYWKRGRRGGGRPGGNCMPDLHYCCKVFSTRPGSQKGIRSIFCLVVFFSFLNECAYRVFSRSGALRRLLLRGLGIMGQELAKGHRTFSSAMGVPTERLGKRQFRNDYWRYYYKRDSISTQALATSSADWRGVLLLMPDMTEPRRTKGHKHSLNMV